MKDWGLEEFLSAFWPLLSRRSQSLSQSPPLTTWPSCWEIRKKRTKSWRKTVMKFETSFVFEELHPYIFRGPCSSPTFASLPPSVCPCVRLLRHLSPWGQANCKVLLASQLAQLVHQTIELSSWGKNQEVEPRVWRTKGVSLVLGFSSTKWVAFSRSKSWKKWWTSSSSDGWKEGTWMMEFRQSMRQNRALSPLLLLLLFRSSFSS